MHWGKVPPQHQQKNPVGLPVVYGAILQQRSWGRRLVLRAPERSHMFCLSGKLRYYTEMIKKSICFRSQSGGTITHPTPPHPRHALAMQGGPLTPAMLEQGSFPPSCGAGCLPAHRALRGVSHCPLTLFPSPLSPPGPGCWGAAEKGPREAAGGASCLK